MSNKKSSTWGKILTMEKTKTKNRYQYFLNQVAINKVILKKKILKIVLLSNKKSSTWGKNTYNGKIKNKK